MTEEKAKALSNPESFIQEVTEEVRRDRVYSVFRKYGWIGGVLILGIVGGTAFVEWQKSHSAGRAEGFGDALIEALDTGTPEARRAALEGVAADGEQLVLRDMIIASDPEEDRAATLAALERVLANPAATPVWRDLAVLRKVMVLGAELPLAERRGLLEEIATAGRPYRAMAMEQLAYLLVEEGRTDEAITALNALTTTEQATMGLRTRAGQMVTALGGKPPAVASDAVPGDAMPDGIGDEALTGGDVVPAAPAPAGQQGGTAAE